MKQTPKQEYQELLQFTSSENQEECLKALISKGTIDAAAKQLDIAARNVTAMLTRIRKMAIGRGWSPDHGWTEVVPEGYHIKGVSTLRKTEDGIQWVKSDRDKEAQAEAFREAIDSMTKFLKPLRLVKPPKATNSSLCTLYTFTDFHIGQYSYGKETGADWDIRIAEKILFQSLLEMMEGSPDSDLGIFNIQGDFEHWDGLVAVTPTANNVLDADTRFDRLVELSIRLAVDSIHHLLSKHKRVKVLICEGNHNISGSVWLRKCLKQLFLNNKRVEIDDTAFPYYAHLHGEIMLGFHHGHKMNNKRLPALFAAEPRYREMWGKAKYTYIHTGHTHHAEQDMSEEGGAIVERHPTLAARDAHTARGGWVSWRAARAITYHKTRGEISRISVVPEPE